MYENPGETRPLLASRCRRPCQAERSGVNVRSGGVHAEERFTFHKSIVEKITQI